MRIITLILFYYFAFFIFKSQEEQDLKTLRLVQIVFRHGDRAPVITYPTDPYRNISAQWPNGPGQLTELGQEEQYNLGRYLRNRYDGFLPTEFNKEEVQIISSEFDRTIQSAHYTLAGLFENYSNFSSNLSSIEDIISWVNVSIPIHVVPRTEDNILFLHYTKPCPKLDEAGWLADEVQSYDLTEENRTLVEYVREKAGFSSNVSLIDVIKLEDALSPLIRHNLTLPDWLNTSMILQLASIRLRISLNETSTLELKRLKSGPLLKILLNNMTNKTHNLNQSLKFIMYSAHDSTLLGLLDTLGVFYPVILPPYSSAVILELHEDPANFYWLELYYKNDSSIDPYQLTIPGCTSNCPIDQFEKLTKDVIPENWDLECASSSPLGLTDFVILGIIGILVLGFLFWFTYATCKKEKKSRLYREPQYSYGSVDSRDSVCSVD